MSNRTLRRAGLVVGILTDVPIWYHVLFTAILLPMAIVGRRLVNN